MRHHFAFTLTNELAFSAALRHPAADSDLMTNMQWCYETNLFATEALAEIRQIELPSIELPAPRESRGRVAIEIDCAQGPCAGTRMRVLLCAQDAGELVHVGDGAPLGDALCDGDSGLVKTLVARAACLQERGVARVGGAGRDRGAGAGQGERGRPRANDEGAEGGDGSRGQAHGAAGPRLAVITAVPGIAGEAGDGLASTLSST